MSGELRLRCWEHEVEGTVEEFEAAMALMERLRRLGIGVGQKDAAERIRDALGMIE